MEKSTWADKPKDFYTLLNNLIAHFLQVLNKDNVSSNDKEGYLRLINMDIQRKILKKSIMTIPYNVSDYQIVKYIKDNFIHSEQAWYILKDNPDVK